ncbi:hypothetical protein BGX34_002816 [Mortierella sp. NVP85]|nr:hypothetical protein BGX34_002816 [Mortierella sp. NVP85]
MSLLLPTSPLEIPELLRKISSFVATKDAVACAQVCKVWSDHFASAIWHTIDFDIHKKLLKTDTTAFARYGHHVRVVKKIKKLHHIRVLLLFNLCRLKRLSIIMTATQEYYAHVSDLLRRINKTTQRLEIYQPTSTQVPFFSVDPLLHPSTGATSKLSYLEIQGLTMTRDAFSSLLRNSPALTTIDIRDSTLAMLPGYNRPHPDEDYYRHHGVIELGAGFGQVFFTEDVPSLLVHFPNLTLWETWDFPTPSEPSVDKLKSEVTRYCPMLLELWSRDPSPMASGMIAQALNNLTTIGVEQRKLDTELVMAILHHQETLEYFGTFHDDILLQESDIVPRVEGGQLEAGWIIQSIPRLCTRLETLKLPDYEMNMSDIENAKWMCHNLETLFIRIRGLNTKEKIDRAIRLWKRGRPVTVTVTVRETRSKKEKKSAPSGYQSVNAIPQEDNSIEARVARHLLKFRKLRMVWLGWKIHEVHRD